MVAGILLGQIFPGLFHAFGGLDVVAQVILAAAPCLAVPIGVSNAFELTVAILVGMLVAELVAPGVVRIVNAPDLQRHRGWYDCGAAVQRVAERVSRANPGGQTSGS